MTIGQRADNGRGDGLAQGEEGAEGAAEEDDVVAVVDGAGEAVLVRVEEGEGVGEDCGRGGRGVRGVDRAIEFEQFGEEGQDECE